LFGDGSKHWLGNFLDFHEGATRELQQGQLDGKSEAVRRPPAAIDQLSLFFGEGVVAGNLAIAETDLMV
jgi:hypothetical protein